MKKKSLSAKKTIPSNFNFKKILKDKKILEIYKNFENKIQNLNDLYKVAISVSGGPDSMALCFLVCCYKFKINAKFKPFFYLVDHGLRKESKIEAQLVKKQLNLYKIKLKILNWKGKKPNSNLQSLARNKRYKLIFNECNKSNIKTLLTAHHQDDIYETFFSRLLRGSGTEGLSSFSEIEKKFIFKNNLITVVRPLLSLNKEDLLYISKKVFNFYVNDPSNKMERFQRVRLRNLIENLKNQGLDFKKLNLTIKNLASSNKAINEIVDYNISQNTFFQKKKYIISSNFFLFSNEIIFRSFANIIKKISGKKHPPRGKKMINLINELKFKDRIKATLGGTLIEKIHNSVIVCEEKRKKG